MRPLFTIHAGEYLVGEHIQQSFKRLHVWVPARDTGVDLLVSDGRFRRCVSLQVKFSRDFLVTHMGPDLQKQLRATGWWTINRAKLAKSPAQYWVFVLLGFASRSTDFVVVPRERLLMNLDAIHGQQRMIQVYLSVTEANRCWETRGLNRDDVLRVANGTFRHPHRDLTPWLNNWKPISGLNR